MARCRRERPRNQAGGLDRWLALLLPLHHQFSHRGLQNPGRIAGHPSEIEREGEGVGGEGRREEGGRKGEMVVGEIRADQ